MRFASNQDAPDHPCHENMDPITPFAPNPEVEEYFDSNAPDFEEEDPPQNFLNDPNSDPFDTQSTYFDEPESQNRRSQRIAGYEPLYDGLMTVHTCAHTPIIHDFSI